MISVCIPTYNGEKFIKEQLSSIINQLDAGDEIIISDDSSTDNTLAIVRSLNDSRIKIIEKCTFKSPIFNMENALNQAKGDYIFLADQDDVWLENKITTMVSSLNHSDLVVSDCIVTDKNGKHMVNSFFEYNDSKAGLINNLIKNNYIGCCMAFKRKILKKALPFPKDIPLHDLWLGFVAELFYKTVFIKEPLLLYRRHENAISFTGEKSKYGLLKKLSFRVNCIKYIPLLMFR